MNLGLRPWRIAVDLLLAIVAGAGAAVLLLFAAFMSLIGGWPLAGPVVVAITLSIAMTAWLSRRRRPRSDRPRSWAEWMAAGRRGMLAAFAVCAVAAGAALAGSLLAMKPPAQAKIASALREHRGDFEALRDMVVADRLAGVIDGGDRYSRESLLYRTPGELEISPARAAVYRQRMKAASCPRIDVWPNGSVLFSMGGWGFASRGWRMSLMWSSEKPTPLLPTLDGFHKTQAASTWEYGYSALGDDWYAAIVW